MNPSPSVQVSSPAKQIGEYEIDRELGRGAFGVVYRAHHRARPENVVAIKVVEGRGSTDRMMLEPALLARLDHMNIVRLEDYFLRDDDLVLALEYIDGRDIGALLDEGVSFSQTDVVHLLIQIGSALVEAHRQGVIHRDIKPSNILAVRDPNGWRFVLTDFGIGQVREGIQVNKQTGGTYLYMAPEQLRGRPGPQSDLWALGVVAYRLLTGKLPFPGPTLPELTRQILYGDVPPLGGNGKIEPNLERTVLRLLDRALEERTASAGELLADLGEKTIRRQSSIVPRTGMARMGGDSLDRQVAFGIRLRKGFIAITALLYLLSGGFVSGILALTGMVLFYFAHQSAITRRPVKGLLWGGAFACFATNSFFSWVMPFLVAPTRVTLPGQNLVSRLLGPGNYGWLPELIALGVILLAILIPLLPVFAGSLFAALRRLERTKLLRDLAIQQGAASQQYLEALRQALDTRFEDVGLHLKYAEALLARGKVKEAAVEARLLLQQDPYNFSGNLLLANAYHSLGLDEECINVCEQYLAVSGYCFEFDELRQQCRRRVG